MLADDACIEQGVDAEERYVEKGLEHHLETVMLSRTTRKRQCRVLVELDFSTSTVLLETERSINAFVPALAALGGLGTTPHHLHKMIAFDTLHVNCTSVS